VYDIAGAKKNNTAIADQDSFLAYQKASVQKVSNNVPIPLISFNPNYDVPYCRSERWDYPGQQIDFFSRFGASSYINVNGSSQGTPPNCNGR
jgi:hypothetical protein